MAEKHVPLPTDLTDPRAREVLDERLRDLTNRGEDSNVRPRGFALLGPHIAGDEIELRLSAGAGRINKAHALEDRGGRRQIPNRFIVTWRDVDVSLRAAGTWTDKRVTFDYYTPEAATVYVLLMRRD